MALTKQQKLKIRQLHNEGQSIPQICRELNLQYIVVQYWVDPTTKNRIAKNTKKHYDTKIKTNPIKYAKRLEANDRYFKRKAEKIITK